ncbi:SCO2524 family protein [Nocardia sp. XZ_19_369]|uniref:SCO2524 family protein n=1 Tax=Nocardia sp. XZ_19_369 TaxID=2769487 RepID=UPI0027D26664|nr:SCO2524 family protein [Nocardia sp. XZ_19_369]
MRIQPREQLLDVWRALLAACWDGQHWRWGEQADTNSISDSEQLLCLLCPATEIDIFALAHPDRIQGDVAGVLEPIGKRGRLGGFVVSLLEQYLERNTDEHGEPSFAAGNYLRGEPTDGQRRIEVVTSYSMSLTVCLSGLRFLQACRAETRYGELTDRIGELRLLDERQIQLAQALRLRWELAQRYWSALARFGSGRWPLEDIPWRTSDGSESDYFSLLVSAVLVQDLTVGTASDDDLTRAVKVFEEFAARGRITRKATRDDPAVGLHTPGLRLTLCGSESVEDGPVLHWEVSDFAPTLLQQVLRAAGLSSNIDTRDTLIELAKSVMDHLDRRMLRSGADGLWDDPAGVFGDDGAPVATKPSWSITERVVECLIAAERLYREPPPQWPELQRMARNLLTIAEHSYDQTKLGVDLGDRSASLSTLDHVEARIDAARQQLHRNPATTFVHALDALRDLEQLSIARRDASRGN